MHEQLKQAGVQLAPLSPPPIPQCGWEAVTDDNHRDMAEKIPVVLPGRIPSSPPPPPPHTHIHAHARTHIYYHNPSLPLRLYVTPSLFSLFFNPYHKQEYYIRIWLKVWGILLAKEHFEHSLVVMCIWRLVYWRNWKSTIATLPFVMSDVP